MRDADHDDILDILGLIQLTESVATKIHGVFDQDEIFRILSDELKRSEKHRMMTLLLNDEGDEFRINAITVPDGQVRAIETLIGRKVIGFTATYKDMSCFHRVVEQGDTYPIQTMDCINQLLPGRVGPEVGALTGHMEKSSIISPIRIHDRIIGVFGIDTPDSAAFSDHLRLSVKNLTQHLSTALQLAEEHHVRKKMELVMKDQRDLFEKIVVTVPGVIYTFKLKSDGSVRFPFSTPSMFTLFGIRPEDIEEDASSFMQLIHPDDLEKVNEAIRVSAQSMTECRIEHRSKHPQKGWIWVEVHSLPVAGPNGSIVWTGFIADITQRKLADEKLRVAEENLKSAFHISPSIIAKADIVSGHFIDVNAAVTRILGYTVTEFTSEPIAGFIHEDDRERTVQEISEQLKGKQTISFENRYACKDGSYKWIAWNTSQADEEGIVIATGIDITGRKLAEQQLLEGNAKRDAILRTAMDGFIRIGLNGNVLEVNESFCRKTGFTAEECTAMHISDVDAFLTPEQVKRQIQMIVKNGEVRFETKMRRKDGSSYDVELNATYNKENKDEFVVFIRDITERKKAEAKLRKLSAAIEQSPSSVIMTDLKGNITYVNPKFEKATGFTADKVIGKNPRLLRSGHTGKEEYKELWETITAGKTWTGEFHNRKRDGTLFWESASIGPIFNDEGEITDFLAVKEDITKLKRAEEELEKTLRSLETRVEERTTELQVAKDQLEQTHNDFQDSLRYAKQIQESIIPSDEEMSKLFSGVFSIYKPKDVISGDFYWCHDNGDETILVVADCTGHGVPGALMSMAGHELLDSIVIGRNITRTDMILEEMDLGMKKLLGRQDARFTMNDGMDMSVVRIGRSGQFDYSGAQSHGLYVKQGEVIPLIPDRAGIGGRGGVKIADFTVQRFEYEHGDRFYLFSDGYYDQFGGLEAKKMMRKRFTELVDTSSKRTMKEQYVFLEHQFDSWKGTEDQVDDVTVVGIEL